MKNITLYLLFLASCMLSAQTRPIAEAEIKLSKDARKSGSYFGGGFDHSNNQLVAIFNYEDSKEGVLFDVYRFDANNDPLEPLVGLSPDALAEQLRFESTDTDQKKSAEDYDGNTAILVRSNFIGRDIVIEKGWLNHERELMVKAGDMTNPFYNSHAWMVDRLLFEQEEKEKVDMDMMPMGTLVSEGQYDEEVLQKMQTAQESGPASTGLIGALADQAKSGASALKASLNSAFMKEDGKAVVIGRVVEKVKIGNPVPWNNNRLRVATVDGSTMTARETETYVMPFAFIPAETEAIDNFQKMVALLVPLNSPNTVKEAKKYQMDKENRNRVLVSIINAEGKLEDTVEYRSAGNNGKYAIRQQGKVIFIPAVADADRSGFYNGFVKKPTHFQIAKVENGQLSFSNAYSFEDIEDKVVVPEGEKFKKLKPGEITWQQHKKLGNGDMIFFATDEDYFYAFQTDSQGNLKHLYRNERYDPKGKVVDSRFVETPSGKLLWITRETPEGVQDTDIDLRTSMSLYNDGFTRGTVTTATATPRNVMEIKAVMKLAQVDPQKGKLGAQQVVGGKDYLVVGDSGYLMNEDGEMVMLGYDIEKKKKLYAIRLQN